MAAIIHERTGSRNLSITRDGGGTQFLYFIRDAADGQEAYNLAVSTSSDTYQPTGAGVLIRQKVSTEELGGGCYLATVEYQSGQPDEDASAASAPTPTEGDDPGTPLADGPNVAGDVDPTSALGREFTFSTGGGTTHITTSRETRSATKAGGGLARDFKGLIGANGEGCDIIAPDSQFQVTYKVPAITIGRFKRLQFCTGKVNFAAWEGFGEKEVLFLGCDGSYSDGDQKWKITYRFQFQPTERNIVINDDITVPIKYGWDYLWVLNTVDDTQSDKVTKPEAAYVEKVYSEVDFATELGIGE